MRKLLSLFLSLLLSSAYLFSSSISIDKALENVRNFEKERIGRSILRQQNSNLPIKLVFTKVHENSNALYVFNIGDKNGYVVVSGDDTTAPILGYSDEGTFDPSNIPDAFKYWLEEYATQIAYSSNNLSKDVETCEINSLSTAIAPLLGDIAWNQDAPYNDMCPAYDKNIHSASGCAATAMAQILYYHKWPKVGKGTHTYTPTQYDMGTITVDFSKSQYDWDAMLPSYNSQSSERSKNAVAKLMYDCGVAISMEYGVQSGALSRDWGYALINYFDYDKGATYRSRNSYGINEWDNIIINEINNKRPVYVTGFSSSGGHAFVFDGYDADGFIHVNWGWGAMSNGYFKTTALSPATQGIGGSSGGFNYRQAIITGIEIPKSDSEYSVELNTSEALQSSNMNFAKNATTDISLNGKISNMGWQQVTCDFALGVFDESGKLIEIKNGEKNVTIDLDGVKYGTKFGSVDFSSLCNGNYRIYPISKISDGSNWVRMHDAYIGLPNYLIMKITDNGIALSSPEYYRLKATDVKQNFKIYSKVGTSISAKITNDSPMEYYGEVKVAIYNKSSKKKVAESAGYMIDLNEGESANVNFTDAYSVEAGDYYLAIIDDDMTKLNSYIPISVLPPTGVTAVLQTTKQISFADNNNVPKDNIHISADIKCIQGVYGGPVLLYIYDENGSNILGCLNPENANIENGDTVTINFKGTFENGVVGTKYMAYLVNGEQLVFITPKNLASCEFTLGDFSGVEKIQDSNYIATNFDSKEDVIRIKSDSDINKIEIFNLAGDLVWAKECKGIRDASYDVSSLTSGLYIIKIYGANGNKISKAIKR